MFIFSHAHPSASAAIRVGQVLISVPGLLAARQPPRCTPAHWTVVPNPHFCLVSLKPASNSVSNCSLTVYCLPDKFHLSLPLCLRSWTFLPELAPFSFLPNRIFSPGHSIPHSSAVATSVTALYTFFLKHLFNTSFLPHFCEDVDLARAGSCKNRSQPLI